MDLLSKKYRQAEEISNLKAEIDRLNRCLMESLTHEKNALDVSIKYKETLQEIKAIAECVIDNDNSLKTDHCFGYCDECSSFKHCKLYPYWQITHLITKAEGK